MKRRRRLHMCDFWVRILNLSARNQKYSSERNSNIAFQNLKIWEKNKILKNWENKLKFWNKLKNVKIRFKEILKEYENVTTAPKTLNTTTPNPKLRRKTLFCAFYLRICLVLIFFWVPNGFRRNAKFCIKSLTFFALV